MDSLRVLHVIGALDRGGVETWLLDMAPLLDRARWQFDFCTLGPQRGRYAARLEARGSRVESCPRGAGWARRLYRLLRPGRYAVVHSHVHHFSALVLAVARAAGVPVRLAHSHNTADGRADTPARRFYRAGCQLVMPAVATHRLACSRPAAALFGPAWWRRKVAVVPYGVPTGSGTADPLLRRHLGLEGAPVIGHVGRFEPQKNHHFLLEVAASLRSRRPEIRWLLVGEGPLRREIEDRVQRLGLAEQVRFSGLREDVPVLMSGAMDAFALPSHHEGLPVALLEAQAAGLPALVSTAVPREAAAVAGAVEFLPLAAGPAAWADGLLGRLAAPRPAREQAGRELAAAGFTLPQSLERLLAIYEQAVGRS
jgi:glycosyltransferase involved in cell wall biosynthesis